MYVCFEVSFGFFSFFFFIPNIICCYSLKCRVIIEFIDKTDDGDFLACKTTTGRTIVCLYIVLNMEWILLLMPKRFFLLLSVLCMNVSIWIERVFDYIEHMDLIGFKFERVKNIAIPLHTNHVCSRVCVCLHFEFIVNTPLQRDRLTFKKVIPCFER